ncbi:MAG TPA: tRNA lysidine(34) synthetase TilS [Steroidobacteraceae bacterium]|nr:tRNA lysidine(34) synthetase TilS [Steroidobacteraceae bacterium]
MSSVLEEVRAALGADLPHGDSSHCCVAVSGGLDSTVLLEVLAQLRPHHPITLRAVHIDHGLHPDSSRWATAVRDACAVHGVPCDVVPVEVPRDSGSGLEAAARETRHAVLRERLRDGEVLVTAHHADDQIETLLLALLRGSGVKGLASMPRLAPLARGWQWRPLLAFTRQEIEAYARARSLSWHEDPANRDLRHDRNYLRHAVLPRLRERWPHASQNAVRTARHLAEAGALLDRMALDDLRLAAVGPCLDVEVLRQMGPARARQLLRFWLDLRGSRTSERRLDSIIEAAWVAAQDRVPGVSLDEGATVRRHRGLLYLVPPEPARPSSDAGLTLTVGEPVDLPDGLGRLELDARALRNGALEPAVLSVRFRGGGERVRLPGRSHGTPLKELMRAAGVLPWMRDRVPLLFAGDELIAIGTAPVAGLGPAHAPLAAALHWSAAPAWRALR